MPSMWNRILTGLEGRAFVSLFQLRLARDYEITPLMWFEIKLSPVTNHERFFRHSVKCEYNIDTVSHSRLNRFWSRHSCSLSDSFVTIFATTKCTRDSSDTASHRIPLQFYNSIRWERRKNFFVTISRPKHHNPTMLSWLRRPTVSSRHAQSFTLIMYVIGWSSISFECFYLNFGHRWRNLINEGLRSRTLTRNPLVSQLWNAQCHVRDTHNAYWIRSRVHCLVFRFYF